MKPSTPCACVPFQVWLTPDEKGVTPQYGSSEYGAEQRHNKLLQVLGGTGQGLKDWANLECPNQIKLHQVSLEHASFSASHFGLLSGSENEFLMHQGLHLHDAF